MGEREPERLAQLAGAVGKSHRLATPATHLVDAGHRRDRTDEHGRAAAARAGDDVGAGVDAVRQVAVQVARRTEHHRVARRLPAERVGGRIVRRVGLHLHDAADTRTVHEQLVEQRRCHIGRLSLERPTIERHPPHRTQPVAMAM